MVSDAYADFIRTKTMAVKQVGFDRQQELFA
jgi:hypothetical protein